MRLNLGCGRKPLAGSVNVDVSDRVGADVVHDLNCMPWPFSADTFEEVHAYDVLEHLGDLLCVMEEIHRVSRPGAVVHVTVPHFSSANAFTDPTHRHWFGWASFDYFQPQHELAFYSQTHFRIRTRRLVFYPRLINKAVWRLANGHATSYERHWAWMFPAWFLSFELEVLK